MLMKAELILSSFIAKRESPDSNKKTLGRPAYKSRGARSISLSF